MLDPVELFPEVPNIYAFPSVHADMVFDKSRVAAYRDAINETVKPGDVVADLGSGTGLLSFLCLQAGAARVHAIERSDVIEWSKELADKNGFSDRMEFHKKDARDESLELGEKVDVIVSELMGHVAFEEGMAETICVAKERFLKPGGATIPQTVTLRAALVHADELYRNYIDSWNVVEGIDYSAMREKAVQSAYVVDIHADQILSDSQIISVEAFLSNPRDTYDTFSFTSWRTGSINGLAFWFDADLTDRIRLSSGPRTYTHWQQCFIPFEKHIKVSAKHNIQVLIEMKYRKSFDQKFEFKISKIDA
ncbi:MAG: methyltransferase domain-containing protein [Rhodospirillaceae bacterium]|nr:methyltransferase domain-containing protein [Rhodospirillaceae bacterium]MBT3883501.1 methyltransferase domain-containing protein [Rhodospirillaceae bacterium]MBT4118968.1 methyltransferase domain-containing protein [Rhodospirillaceae bacterium]MBT4673761.1 methyltransferase domain-containing protein [Rhodospirillaceae bacterium]MBT4748979.1 methyltransferase domain-containing protein [Rhodospirillaceae bacterium]